MTKAQLLKFEWVVEDPFYSTEWDTEVLVTDDSLVQDLDSGEILDTVTEDNIDQLYRDWYEFTSQDWDTERSAPVPN